MSTAGTREDKHMIKVYTSPVIVSSDGTVVNPEPGMVVIDGVEYVPAARGAR